ncbi:MAG: HD-GYP domain-containing protein [Tepidiformaceae bacterium]
MPAAPLPSRVAWFIAAVFMAGAAAFTLSFYVRPLEDWVGLAIVVALTVLSERFPLKLYFDGRVSLSFVGVVVAVLIFGAPGAAIVAAAIAVSGGYYFAERSPNKLAFNFGQQEVAVFGGSALAAAMGVHEEGVSAGLLLFGGTITGVLIFALTSSAVTAIMSFTAHRSPVPVYRSNFVWLWPHYAVLGLMAGGLAVAYDHLGPSGLLVLALPLVLSRYSMKQVLDKTRDNVVRLERSNEQLRGAVIEVRDMSMKLSEAYNGTLESLVAALDMRDQETRGHSTRVATHAVDLSKMLGVNDPAELDMFYRGALMHDVGKIGVPDAILRKPGKLTEEEWVFMRKHPALGYRILAQVPYLRPAAHVVLAHHERWDGDGYPRRLKGEDIPLGARVFSLCDTYDAILSDRPYRKGQSPDAAFAEILRCAGTQFDPKVVEAFEAAFPRWREEVEGASPLYLPAWKGEGDEAGRAAG